ncbi:MAG TPA: hypothetical protein VIF40_17880 [Methylosinus sp.]|uniref:hypothetical protein n=1 Tax=Methylosinus sp. TaxID=427 RepID=UPI002F943E1B
MSAAERANEEEDLASAERAAIADLLEKGFLHVKTFTGSDGGERLAWAGRLEKELSVEGCKVTILHRARVTRVYATRPKRVERYPA